MTIQGPEQVTQSKWSQTINSLDSQVKSDNLNLLT